MLESIQLLGVTMQLPVWLASVHHDGSGNYVSNPYPQLGESVRLRLRVGSHAPVKRVFLRTFPDGEQALTPIQLDCVDPPNQWWQVEVEITEPVLHYRFIVQAEDGVWFYSANGALEHDPLDEFDFRLLANYQPPGWVFEQVFYQIFPDRFANGDPTNDPQPEEFEFRGSRPQTYPWGKAPPQDQLFSITFYGGDLEGIRQRLDYLADLGVSALYLTPVFSAYSNHKYDVIDYDHVDEHFGGDEALVRLREALNQRKMRYILDIVPNHTGYWHPWFQKAQADRTAPEAGFYTFGGHPQEYASWLGVWTLPKLNYTSPELRQRIYGAPQSVFRRWLRAPFFADGWRVDVANMLGRQGATQLGVEVAQGIRQAVKDTQPQAYLIGENFFDGSKQLQGDQWDGVMNYAGFMKPLLAWLVGYRQGAHGLHEQIVSPQPWSSSALAATWRERLAAIPWATALQQYNLLDSHDTSRIRSVVMGNDALHRLAAIVQFTYPGVPGIYYGDEVGLLDDPQLAGRACMTWEPAYWDQELHAFYKALISLRRTSPILQGGGFQILMIEQDVIAYQREHPAGRIIVVAQRSSQPRPAGAMPVFHGGVPDGTRFREYFSGLQTQVLDGGLILPELPQGATLWQEFD